MDWFVYLIRCADGSLYTGISTDVERRFQEHCAGGIRGAKYLRGKGPLQLVYQTTAANRSEASRLEYRIKRLEKADKERLIIKEISITSLL